MRLKQNISEISNDPQKLRAFKKKLVLAIFAVLVILFLMGKFTYNVDPFSYYRMSSEEKPIAKKIYALEKEYKRISNESDRALSKYMKAAKETNTAGGKKVSGVALYNWYSASKEADSYRDEWQTLIVEQYNILEELNDLKKN